MALEVDEMQLGKRYECPACGTEILVLRPSDAVLHCCGQPMTVQGLRTVASAD